MPLRCLCPGAAAPSEGWGWGSGGAEDTCKYSLVHAYSDQKTGSTTSLKTVGLRLSGQNCRVPAGVLPAPLPRPSLTPSPGTNAPPRTGKPKV